MASYCAQHGGGLTPAQVTLDFDGDVLPPRTTLAEHDFEDDDLIDVKVR